MIFPLSSGLPFRVTVPLTVALSSSAAAVGLKSRMEPQETMAKTIEDRIASITLPPRICLVKQANGPCSPIIPAQLQELGAWESCNAGPVNCNGWFASERA